MQAAFAAETAFTVAAKRACRVKLVAGVRPNPFSVDPVNGSFAFEISGCAAAGGPRVGTGTVPGR